MLTLSPMTETIFKPYYDAAVAGYAQEHVRGGRWSAEEAPEASAREFEGLLPNGLQTPGNHFFSLCADGIDEPVGMLWFAERTEGGQQIAFIYDIRIKPAFQRRGFASQAIQALEEEARRLGLSAIGLHVFGHNHAARALYEKLNFEVTNVIMRKSVAL